MTFSTKTIALTFETPLTSAGLRLVAEELAHLAETIPSAAHAMTYRSMSAAVREQATLADALEQAA